MSAPSSVTSRPRSSSTLDANGCAGCSCARCTPTIGRRTRWPRTSGPGTTWSTSSGSTRVPPYRTSRRRSFARSCRSGASRSTAGRDGADGGCVDTRSNARRPGRHRRCRCLRSRGGAGRHAASGGVGSTASGDPPRATFAAPRPPALRQQDPRRYPESPRHSTPASTKRASSSRPCDSIFGPGWRTSGDSVDGVGLGRADDPDSEMVFVRTPDHLRRWLPAKLHAYRLDPARSRDGPALPSDLSVSDPLPVVFGNRFGVLIDVTPVTDACPTSEDELHCSQHLGPGPGRSRRRPGPPGAPRSRRAHLGRRCVRSEPGRLLGTRPVRPRRDGHRGRGPLSGPRLYRVRVTTWPTSRSQGSAGMPPRPHRSRPRGRLP